MKTCVILSERRFSLIKDDNKISLEPNCIDSKYFCNDVLIYNLRSKPFKSNDINVMKILSL